MRLDGFTLVLSKAELFGLWLFVTVVAYPVAVAAYGLTAPVNPVVARVLVAGWFVWALGVPVWMVATDE